MESGKVTAVAAGSAVISASAGNVKAQCNVTVVQPSSIKLSFSTPEPDNEAISGAGGSVTVHVTADDNWTLVSSGSWLTVTPSSGGAGEITLTLTTQQNATKAVRTGTLSVKENPSLKLEFKQMPYIYSRKKVASGTVTNSLLVNYSSGTKLTRVYAFMPVPQSNAYQDISNLSVGEASIKDCGNNANQYAVADICSIPSSGGAVLQESFHADAYEVTADVSLVKEIPEYNTESDIYKLYLGAEEGDLINPSNAQIVSTADILWSAAGGNLLDYARRCYQWTATNMTYGNMNTGLHTITNLMQTRKGDCGNFSSVFISLLRAHGIPSRHIVMLSPTEAGYHVRAEFYLPGYGWIAADPTFRNSNPSGDYFGKFTGKYVVMSFGINSLCKDPDGKDYRADLLQSCFWWYWYSTQGSITFKHSFSSFR